MSHLLTRLTASAPESDQRRIIPERGRGAALDLVHLSRRSLGDRALEAELLWLFDRQADLALTRLHDLESRSASGASAMGSLLAASARTIGAFATAVACDGYVALVERGASAEARRRALDIVGEEVGIVRDAITDLLAR